MATVMERYGAPLSGMEVRFVNGKFYRRLVPLVGANSKAPPPPAAVLWVLTRVHPAFRRREKRALEAMDGKTWRKEVARWYGEQRPMLVERNRALQDEAIEGYDDAELADHLRRAFTNAREGHVLHFELHGTDLGPVGDLLAHTRRWGLPDADVVAVLRGSSPASAAPTEPLARLGALVAAAPSKPTSLDDVRAISPAAAAALDEYLRDYGSRIVTNYDVDGHTLAELPEAVLASILAWTAPKGDTEGDVGAAVTALRERVPEQERAVFDDCLAEARHVYGLRDDNGPITAEWPIGLLRRALLEAGRRLHERGLLHEPEQVVELHLDEATALVTGATSAPSPDEVAERAAARAAQAVVQAPPVLGRDDGPPALSAFPPGLARVTAAVLAAVEAIDPPAARTPLAGTGIGTRSYTGRARVAARAEDVLRTIEPGDVLVAPFTTPAYNTVLTIAGAIVVEEGGVLCHAAVMARELEIPAVIGAQGAMTRIDDGAMVEVDPVAGRVRVVAV
jgi:pyruvate,water dikinase